MKDLLLIQRILEEQGYLVVACEEPQPLGTKWDFFGTTCGMKIPGPVIVIAPSSKEEHDFQSLHYGMIGRVPFSDPTYVRVGAE